MFPGFEKLFNPAEVDTKETSQMSETSERVWSMSDLRAKLDEIFPSLNAGGEVDVERMQDASESNIPSQITLEDGTVVTLPTEHVPVGYNTETGVCGISRLSEINKSHLDSNEKIHPTVASNVDGTAKKTVEFEGNQTSERVELTDEQKSLIIEETGWASEIVNCIESKEQYEVYKKANLHCAEIDNRPCLVKNIDMNYVDLKTGLTNRELLEKGRAPIDAATGEKIELHHMGQSFHSPFAELCENSEHGDGNDGILHDKKVESWRRDPEQKNQYAVQRANHWKSRAGEV